MNKAAIRNGIRPSDFRQMTPREVHWRIEALAQDRNRELERMAQLACWVLSPFIGKPLQVSDLVLRPGKTADVDWDAWAKN